MPQCPKCNKDIDYLNEYDRIEALYHFSVVDGEETYALQDYIPDACHGIDWECPLCAELLFTDMEHAKAFLTTESQNYPQAQQEPEATP